MLNKLVFWARPVSILLIVGALLLLILCLTTQEKNTTVFGPTLGADYPAFYIAGKTLNSEPDRLYDLQLQYELYHQLAPRSPTDWFAPYPYAPFFAVLFQPLALLPYQWSYLAWLIIGVIFFSLGIWLLRNSGLNFAANNWLTATLLSASFTPFLFEGWLGGQTSPFVFFCVASAIYLQSRERDIAAGSVLAALLFKPTLLLLIMPMFLICRQLRVLIGFVAGGLVFLSVSLWAVGIQGCLNFMRFLKVYMEVRRTTPESLKPWKYVDVRSAVYPLFYHPTSLTLMILLSIAGITGILLLCAWRRERFKANKQQSLALALLWTPILSPHCAIYDTSLLIPAAIMMATNMHKSSPIFVGLLALTYVTAWFSQPISASIGFQPLTLSIALLGFYQLRAVFLGTSDETHKASLPDRRLIR